MLPPEVKQQVVDFVAFMKERYVKPEDKTEKLDDISSLFGILNSDKAVSLEGMDAAIRQRGSEL